MLTKRNAVIGAAAVALGRVFLRRRTRSAATRARSRLPLMAGIGAAVGALLIWRRRHRQQRQAEFFDS